MPIRISGTTRDDLPPAPDDLAEQVRAMLDDTPTLSWDEAIAEMVGERVDENDEGDDR